VRMTPTKTGLAATAALLLTSSGQAQTPAVTPAKIAIINIQGAILATKDGDKARNDIQAKFADRVKGQESRVSEINRLKDQFNKGANTMSAEAREKLTREIDDKQKKYQWDAEDLQNDFQQEQGKLVNEIGQRMIQVIDGYAKDGGYAVVLDVSGEQSPVLWAATGIDITQDIVKLYDGRFAAGAPASPSAAGGAAKPGTPAGTPATGGAITKPIIAPPPAAVKKPPAPVK
jgi:outer membrane protein